MAMDLFLLGGDVQAAPITTKQAGSKAANLVRLARIGLRVPPAFVLGAAACGETISAGGRLSDEMRAAVRSGVAHLERATGRRFGGRHLPLLVSVRSSPPVSMPGMLDTVLNVGLTDASAHGLLRSTGNPYLVWDTHRRFAQAFAEIVRGCRSAPFTASRDRMLAQSGATSVDEVDPLALRDLARDATALVEALSGAPLPSDPNEQLEATIGAVFRSWLTPRAVEYRRRNGVDESTGTAVIVQAMVLGNDRGTSGSGVGFTRNPSTGADELYIDFLRNSQGEDVVSGRQRIAPTVPLAQLLPRTYEELCRAKVLLETEFRDMQDFEFTVENGELFFLQSRNGKRTPWAALQIAVDLVRDRIIRREDALRQLEAYDIDSIHRVRLVPDGQSPIVASAIPAGLGVAAGVMVFDAQRAKALASTKPVILVREDLSTDDFPGLAASAGILTAHGGRTSHAAVVARQLGKVCLVGCATLRIDEASRRCTFGSRTFAEGEAITLDGDSGLVYAGFVPTVIDTPDAALTEIRKWYASPLPALV
jgi:pyruvate,orthophosphate dikinase